MKEHNYLFTKYILPNLGKKQDDVFSILERGHPGLLVYFLNNPSIIIDETEHFPVYVPTIISNKEDIFKIINKNNIMTDQIIDDDLLPKLVIALPLGFKSDKDGLTEIKNKLVEWYNLNYSDNNVQESNLVDPVWINNNITHHNNKCYLLAAINFCQKLNSSLSEKEYLRNSINTYYDTEINKIQNTFLLEMGLDKSTFNKSHFEMIEAYKLLDAHPIFGKKKKDLKDRYDVMCKSLLSEDDKFLINQLWALSKPINIMVVRQLIKLGKIIEWNLDDYFPADYYEDFSVDNLEVQFPDGHIECRTGELQNENN